MSEMFDGPQNPAVSPFGWREIEGNPRPGIEETVDQEIYKVMVAQRREANRRNLPDLEE
ncbi:MULTISPECIES: hypothetical protein [unclassified Roseovarius]|uniref:hypothetical protein n=1 Tax=unclassified Roseovarius TaxID=2614913 RepID=UPI00273F4A67|nr:MULTISPECIES: hypothetical protein [unclassified Roseovarius]